MGTLTNIFILSLLSFFAFLAVKLGKFSPVFKHAHANAHVKVESWIEISATLLLQCYVCRIIGYKLEKLVLFRQFYLNQF